METETQPKPNLIWSILTMKCPRCRRGDMYKDNNPYKSLKLKQIFYMYDNCPVCNQKYDLEVGFWYGTGYVSYAITVAIAAITFVAWWVLIGISFRDNRVFYWLIINSVLLVVLQPWIMRLSRVVYLYFFVSYDKNFKNTQTKTFDYY
jgi:uncharacterized protein (DUF983 family)